MSNENDKVDLKDLDNAPDYVVDQENLDSDETKRLYANIISLADDYRRASEERDKNRKKYEANEILNSLIEPYAGKAYWFMCSYCFIVAIMLLLHGFSISNFTLPESVLQFLVGSTAVTVIGLVGMVLTGIFVGARRQRDEK